MPQNVASDQGLHCLLTGNFYLKWNKNEKSTPDTPKFGILHLIRMDASTRQIRVNITLLTAVCYSHSAVNITLLTAVCYSHSAVNITLLTAVCYSHSAVNITLLTAVCYSHSAVNASFSESSLHDLNMSRLMTKPTN